MIGSGREDKKDNDLFYTCSLIDYISRKTKNIRSEVVNRLGKERLEKIYNLADVYHCDNIERVSDDFIEEAKLPKDLFHGGLGLFTYNKIKKPHYYVLSMLNKLGDSLIANGDGYFITKQNNN